MYKNKPFIIEAEKAHKEGVITYQKDGIIIFIQKTPSEKKCTIDLSHQYSLIRPTFDDLSKALSSTANSPFYSDGKTLRQLFDEEYAKYEVAVEQASKTGNWEPDYGTYVFDYWSENLYLIAPGFWHRLGLVTNNSKLLLDPDKKLTWQQVREVFDKAVIGFVGASVGGNIFEGVMREIRPKRAKVADYDWIEITNLNRLERVSIQFLAASKASRFDAREPFDVTRISKAEIAAYQQNMVDPYAAIYVYPDGIHGENIEQFLLGNSSEPKIDVLVEECDDFRLKVELRERCRKYNIPVLMLSDFGHLVQGQFQDFKNNINLPLGFNIADKELYILLESALTSGKREDRFNFIKALCGNEFEKDEFGLWVQGAGEQPTSSLPQSGSTAMTSGGIGGKVIAMYLLGYKIPERFIYDLKNFSLDF
jgi:hypothetical protein